MKWSKRGFVPAFVSVPSGLHVIRGGLCDAILFCVDKCTQGRTHPSLFLCRCYTTRSLPVAFFFPAPRLHLMPTHTHKFSTPIESFRGLTRRGCIVHCKSLQIHSLFFLSSSTLTAIFFFCEPILKIRLNNQ